MKKRLIVVSCMLVLVMMLTALFAACATVVDDDTLYDLLDALKNDYNGKSTGSNFTLPGQLETTDASGRDITVYVKWRVGGTTLVSVKNRDENGRCAVEIDPTLEKTTSYTLKATLTNINGKAYTDSGKEEFTVTLNMTALVAGDSGNQGNSGNTGNTGNTGDTGNSGNQGNTGDTGNTGNSGDTGNSGNSGNTGDTGNSGNTGNTGDTGNSGNSGNSGDSGNSGNSGNTGDSNTGNATEKSVTIVMADQGFTDKAAVSSSISKDGITIAFSVGTGKTEPSYYTNNGGNAVRLYGGNTMTISGKTIVKVVLTFATEYDTNEITVNTGTFTSPDWTGSTDNLVFTIGGTTGNRRIVSMVITYLD